MKYKVGDYVIYKGKCNLWKPNTIYSIVDTREIDGHFYYYFNEVDDVGVPEEYVEKLPYKEVEQEKVKVPKILIKGDDLVIHGYSLKIINDSLFSDGLRLSYQDGILRYKGVDCEGMYQQYMQQKKIPDLEKKVEEQRKQLNGAYNKIDELKKRCKFQHEKNRELKEKMMADLDKMTFQLARIAGILDEDDFD
jgi:hypothetical protein